MSTAFHFDLRASSIPINREHSHQYKYSIPRRKAVYPLIISPVGRLRDLSFDFLYQAFPNTTSKGAIHRQTYADAKAIRDVSFYGSSKDYLRYRHGGKGKHKDKLELVADERWLDGMVDGEVNYMLEQLWSEGETEELEIEKAGHAGAVDRAWGSEAREFGKEWKWKVVAL